MGTIAYNSSSIFIPTCSTFAHMTDRVREKINVTVDPELLAWVDEQIKKKVFANRSHAVDAGWYALKNKTEKP